jgi:hypothetical protein
MGSDPIKEMIYSTLASFKAGNIPPACLSFGIEVDSFQGQGRQVKMVKVRVRVKVKKKKNFLIFLIDQGHFRNFNI